jgi:lysophospholipase L1-like esterase
VLAVACQALVVLLLAEVAVRVAATRSRSLRTVMQASVDATGFTDATTLPELMERTMLGFSPYDVQYGFVLNSRSFRTREVASGSGFDGVRIVALGDSFTFASGGLPHEHHWTTALERRLARRREQAVQVLRLGVPGTGPAFQLRLWQLEAAGLKPGAVVLGFFVGNDFTDHQGDCGELCGGERSLVADLASSSALVRAGRNLIRIRRARAGRQTTPAADLSPGLKPGEPVPGYRDDFDPDKPSFRREEFVAIEARRMALCLRSEAAAFESLLARVSPEVLQLVAEVEHTGARCIVMMIPDQYQVDDGLVDEVLKATGNRREDYDIERPQRRLAEILEAEGVEVLDLLPVFRAKAGRGPFYRPSDTHWNRAGNRVAAAALADALGSGAPNASGAVFGDGFEDGSPAAWKP